MTTSPIDHDELIQFLYLCPVGIAQIDLSGTISLLNAKGSQLLMPYAGAAGLENFFDILDSHDPSFRALSAASAEYGTLCEHRVVRFKPPVASRRSDQHLSFTLLKIGQETIMAVFEDVTRLVIAEAETLELVTSTWWASALEPPRFWKTRNGGSSTNWKNSAGSCRRAETRWPPPWATRRPRP